MRLVPETWFAYVQRAAASSLPSTADQLTKRADLATRESSAEELDREKARVLAA